MRTWTMRDLPSLMDHVNGTAYALDLSIAERKRERIRTALKALQAWIDCMCEAVEDKQRH